MMRQAFSFSHRLSALGAWRSGAAATTTEVLAPWGLHVPSACMRVAAVRSACLRWFGCRRGGGVDVDVRDDRMAMRLRLPFVDHIIVCASVQRIA